MKKAVISGICAVLILAVVISSACILFQDNRTMEEKLSSLEHVTSVEKLDGGTDKYIAVFSVPLDWDNPDAGTFPVRAEIIPCEGSSVTVVQTDGYMIQELALKMDSPNELAAMLNANYVHIEHRFFGESAPADFSNDGTDYWQYLTAENSAADRHLILSELKTLFPGSYVITGSSKGGLDAALFTYFYPEDVDVTVAYSAPCCIGFNDKRMMPYVYEHVGEAQYGAEGAKEYRLLLTEFQEFCFAHRDVLVPKYYAAAIDEGCTFRETCTPDTLFDVIMLDVAMETWQYQYPFDAFAKCLAMPEDSPAALDAKISAVFSLLQQIEPPAQWSVSSPYFPYFYQTAHELGLYYYDFSYVRDAILVDGLNAEISVSREEEENLISRIMFTEEQNALVSFDPGTITGFRKWIGNTDSDIILIYGASDPWYSMKIPKNPENPHVKEYVSTSMAHQVSVRGGFDAEVRHAILEDIRACLS